MRFAPLGFVWAKIRLSRAKIPSPLRHNRKDTQTTIRHMVTSLSFLETLAEDFFNLYMIRKFTITIKIPGKMKPPMKMNS